MIGNEAGSTGRSQIIQDFVPLHRFFSFWKSNEMLMALTDSVIVLYLHFGKDYFSYNKENDEEER